MTEYLRFCEHGKKYALPLSIIQSTLKVVTIDEESGGVINFHGKQIPVLALDFDFEERREIQASDSLIITAIKEGEIALCAAAIEGI
jgi:CheW-like domain.